MLKKILAVVAMLYAAACFAAVDINKAGAAELDGIKGIGPAMSSKILEARKNGNFKDWNDFVERVKGVGAVNAAKFSTEGLTVNGVPYKATAATPAAPAKPAAAATTTAKDLKPAAVPALKADAPKPAASAVKK